MSVSRTLLYSFSYSLLLITTAVVESAEISSSIAAGTVRVLRDNDISSNNTESSSHGFGNSTGDNFNNNNMNNNSSPSTHGNSFEFIAFLVWYLILVGCCIIPTCCAYRRRRLAEQRYLMHQANLQRMRQNGLFVLSNFQHAHPDGMGGSYLVRRYNNGNNHHNSERIQQDRLRALTDTLKGTTMTITANDIETPATTTPIQEACNVNLDETNDEDVVVSDVENAVVTVAENDAHITAGAVESNKTGSATSPTVIEYGIDYFYSEDCNEENDMVRLPLGCKNGDRLVPGVCAICLCPYVDGNQVSWSPDNPCQHAFHTDCIISWLAKKEEPQCPVCRQEFCAAVPMSAEEEDVIEVDLEREAAFLESFSQALAISQLYRPYSSTDDAAAGGHSSSRLSSRDHPLGSRANALQLTNIAMQQRLEMAGFQARHHQQQQQQRRALDSTNAAATADSNDWPVGIIPPALAESPTLPNPNANSSEQVGQNAAPASNDGTPADDNVETGLGSRVSQSQ